MLRIYEVVDKHSSGALHRECTPTSDTYGAVRTPPHLFQVELLHAILIRGDGRALNAHLVFEDSIRRVNRNLVVRLGTSNGLSTFPHSR